jgi:hypothetical protein
LAQRVGHGLLVRVDVYRQLGGLPEYTVLDDLPFGYQLTTAGVPVHVVPVMVAPAPERLDDLIATHRRWLRSYLDYPACARAARRAGRGSRVDDAIALTVVGHRAATWLLATPTTAACAARAGGPRTGRRCVPPPVGLQVACQVPHRFRLWTQPGQALVRPGRHETNGTLVHCRRRCRSFSAWGDGYTWLVRMHRTSTRKLLPV